MRLLLIFLLVFTITLTATSTMLAQDPAIQRAIEAGIEKTRQNQAAVDIAANSSDGAKALHERLTKSSSSTEFRKAISDVVQANDRSVIPYLKARLEIYSEEKVYIEVALVHLGDKEYFDRTIAELLSKDMATPYFAIQKLTLFKTKEAYRKLLELLDDETPRDPNPNDDSILPTIAEVTKERLAETVENPPRGRDVYDTAAWKAWFAKHKELLQ